MSIIKFTIPTLAGSLNTVKDSPETIRVSKEGTAKVVMIGNLRAPRKEQEDGSFAYGPYGQLGIKAALTGTGDAQRLVLEIEGGIRGVLFKFKPKEGVERNPEKDPDYTGRIEMGDGTEYPLFGRTITPENGQRFISLNTSELRKSKQTTNDTSSTDSAAFFSGMQDAEDQPPF
jgi:hypothetical protein